MKQIHVELKPEVQASGLQKKSLFSFHWNTKTHCCRTPCPYVGKLICLGYQTNFLLNVKGTIGWPWHHFSHECSLLTSHNHHYQYFYHKVTIIPSHLGVVNNIERKVHSSLHFKFPSDSSSWEKNYKQDSEASNSCCTTCN